MKIFRGMYIILIVSAIMFSMSFGINLYQYKKIEKIKRVNENNQYLLIQTKNELDSKSMDMNGIVEDNKKLSEQLITCKQELSTFDNIKTNDDLLKRDIAIYIDKRYTTVPRILAVDIAEKIIEVSQKENVSPQLLVGLIEVESRFNPSAISSKKARGLMQVMPEWAPKFNLKHETDLHDVDTGIESGVKVLKIHIDEVKGNITKGLYYYSGKSKTYASKVYESVGRFISFRSTIDSGEEIEEEEAEIINDENKGDVK